MSTATRRKPEWLKVRAPGGPSFVRIRQLLRRNGLHTVCEEARCPNMGECWAGGTATFMLMGDVCTRGCRFCAVTSGDPGGLLDRDEPAKVARSVADLGLRYVVLTSVDRDDLPDGGAEHFAVTVEEIRALDDAPLVETLVPDFQGSEAAIRRLLDAGPDVYAQNQETVRRLTRTVRDVRSDYDLTLEVLSRVKQISPATYTKTSLMLGLGERPEEIDQTMRDLRTVDCDVLTLGQYLQPTVRHHPVDRYVTPEEFDRWAERGRALGFRYVASGPLVRSSYRAGEFHLQQIIQKNA